jgi:membrane fusion protein (multidrug efflux system)
MTRLLVLLSVFLLQACSQGDAQEKKADKGSATKGAALTVSALDVAPRDVPVSFEAVGRTEGSREVQVRARVAGILEKQLFQEGDTVKAGTPLFRIERAPFEIELAQARGALAQEASRHELAKRELERLKTLVDRRAISQKEADQAASAASQSAAAMQVAQARVRQAELNLSYTTVDAPISGMTGRAQQSVGSLVQPNNDSAMLTTMSRADPIWVRFALSEAEYARLKNTESKTVEVKLQTADGAPYPQAGKLNFAGSTVDAATGTVQMRAELPNSEHRLLPGQYVRVQVVAGSQKAIVVPQSAVLQDQSGRFVWVAGADGKALPRQIRAGSWVGSDWIVLEGLKPGETVITDNLIRLRPGTAVQVQKKS